MVRAYQKIIHNGRRLDDPLSTRETEHFFVKGFPRAQNDVTKIQS
jgi:hypothetical protein